MMSSTVIRDGVAIVPLWASAFDLSAGTELLARLADHSAVCELRALIDERRPAGAWATPSADHGVGWHLDGGAPRGRIVGGDVVYASRPRLGVGNFAELALIIAIDDFTVDNGATEFQIGSHRGESTGVLTALMPSGHAVAFVGSHVLHRRPTSTNPRRSILVRYRGQWAGVP